MDSVQLGRITLTEAERAGLEWIKAQASTAYGQCVEVASTSTGKVAVRDSQDPDGPILVYTSAQFREFTDRARNGKIAGLAQ